MSWKCVHPSPYMATVVFLLLMNRVGILALDDYRCGAAGAGKSCPNGLCCSSFGWCGNTSAYCSDGHSDKNGKSGGTESSTSISASGSLSVSSERTDSSDKNGKSGGTDSSTSVSASGSLSVSSEGTDSSDTSSDTSPSNGSNDTTTKIPSDGNDHHKHGHSDKHKKHEDTVSSTSISANASLSLSSESDSSDTFPSGNGSNGATTKMPSDGKDHHKHEHSDKHKKCDGADSQTSVTSSGSVSVSSESTNTSNASSTNGSNGATTTTPSTGASSTPPPPTTTGPPPTTGISSILSSAMFDQFLPNRTNPDYPAKGFYTYDAFIKAANDKMFQGFGTTKDADTQKREIAAFFANMAHETQGGGDIEEKIKSTYCNATCPAGKQYFGRGPLQLSWNYGYDAAGKALGVDLLNDPGKISSDSVLAFKSSLWFWMSSQSPSCHEVMVNNMGFGNAIKIINGALECGDKPSVDGAAEQKNRISLYEKYCKILGVSPGNALTC